MSRRQKARPHMAAAYQILHIRERKIIPDTLFGLRKSFAIGPRPPMKPHLKATDITTNDGHLFEFAALLPPCVPFSPLSPRCSGNGVIRRCWCQAFRAFGVFWWLAQGLAVEGKAVRGVDEAVEDGIGDCRITG
jgi:hypothetical protein